MIKTLVFCLGFLCILTTAPQAYALSLFNIKDGLVQFLLEQVNDPGEFEITVGKVTTPEEGGTRLNKVSISDSQGVWMTVESAEFDWNKSRLLAGEIEIDHITMVKPVVLRAPSSENAPDVEEPDGKRTAADNWPRSPIALHIKSVKIIEADIKKGLLPQRLQFSANGLVRDEGDYQNLALKIRRIDKVDGAIDLSFQRNFDAKTLDLSLVAKEAAGGLVSAFAGLPDNVPVAATIKAAGPDSDWKLNLGVVAQDMVKLDGTLNLGWSGVPFKVDTALTLVPGKLLDPQIQAALSPQARLEIIASEGQQERIMLKKANVRARDLSLVADGYVAKDFSDMNLSTKLVVDGKLATLIDGLDFKQATFDGMVTGSPENLNGNGIFNVRDLAGEAYDIGALALDGTVAVAGENVKFDVTGIAKRPRIDKIAAATVGTVNFKTGGVLSNGKLALEETTVDSKIINGVVSGDIYLEESRLDVTYDVRVPDVAPIAQAYDQSARGAIRETGTAKGTFDNLDIQGTLNANGLFANGSRIGTFVARHTNTIKPEVIAGTLDTRLSKSDYGDGTLKAKYALSGSTLNISSLKGDMLASTIDANAKVNLDNMLATGKIALNVRDLSKIGQLADIPLAGDGTLNATLSTSSRRQGLDVVASLNDIMYDTINVSAINLTAATSALGLKTSPLTLDATLDNLTMPDVVLERVTLQADGSQSNLPVTLSVHGIAAKEPVNLDANAVIEAGEPTRVTVAKFDLDYAKQNIALDAPLIVELGENATSLQNLNVRLPKRGRVTGDFDILANGARGALTIDTVDLTIINDFQPDTINSGMLNAGITFDTRPSTATADMDIKLTGLQLPQAQAAGKINLNAAGVWDGATAVLEATAQGSFAKPIVIGAKIPVQATQSIMPEVQMTQPFSASATWAGDLEELWQYAPLPEHLLAGQTDLDFNAGGTLESPVFSGGLTVKDGLYQNITAGTLLTNLNVTTSLSKQQQVQLDLSAKDGADGTVNSKIVMNFGENATLDATLKADRAVLIRRDDVIARMNIDIGAKGDLSAPAIKGTVDILEAEARLINSLPPSVIDLGEIRTTEDPPRESSGAEPSDGATIDVAINAPNKIFIRGRGLDSEWAIDMGIKGQAASPRITGRIYAVRGRLDFIGTAFDLETGEIAFRGNKKINPNLDVVLTKETSSIRGSIIVEGRADKPVLRFTSSPSLPEDEILPRLVFGRSKQSLSAAEGLQLASGIATLTGGGAGPLDAVRAALGLDALRIESDEDGNSSLAVGRYVKEGVYIGAKQALDGQGGAVVIELDVIDDVTADVEIGQGTTATSAGVNYKYDF